MFNFWFGLFLQTALRNSIALCKIKLIFAMHVYEIGCVGPMMLYLFFMVFLGPKWRSGCSIVDCATIIPFSFFITMIVWLAKWKQKCWARHIVWIRLITEWNVCLLICTAFDSNLEGMWSLHSRNNNSSMIDNGICVSAHIIST